MPEGLAAKSENTIETTMSYARALVANALDSRKWWLLVGLRNKDSDHPLLVAVQTLYYPEGNPEDLKAVGFPFARTEAGAPDWSGPVGVILLARKRRMSAEQLADVAEGISTAMGVRLVEGRRAAMEAAFQACSIIVPYRPGSPESAAVDLALRTLLPPHEPHVEEFTQRLGRQVLQ